MKYKSGLNNMASEIMAISLKLNFVIDNWDAWSVKTAPVRGDVRRVEYSAEMAEVGFPSQSRDGGCPPRGQQLKLNKLWPAREQLDLTLTALKNLLGQWGESWKCHHYLHQSIVEASLEADMVIIKGVTRRDEMWSVIREIEPLSQTAQLILTQRGWFLTRNTWLAEKLNEEGRQPASPLQGKKWIGMRNPNCHLEKLHQELNLWHHPKKASGSRWSIRILTLGQLLGILGTAQWLQLGKMNPLTALKNSLGQWGESWKCHHWASLWCWMERWWRSVYVRWQECHETQDPVAASTPVQTCEEEDKVVSLLKSPLGKKPCFRESIAKLLLKTAPTCLEPNYNDAEFIGFTWPSLVNIIPWIKYEAEKICWSQVSGKSSSASGKSNIFDTS